MTSCKEYAYAKINLYLDVLSKRDDGFHEVKTVMHSLSLCDELTVSLSPSNSRGIHITVSGDTRLPTDSRNLAYRAAELFLDSILLDAQVSIKLKKNIPIAAGLAGGSSDAAAVLRAMNRLAGRPLTGKRLLSLASALGSDVPYCLLGGTAICLGRGEHISRLPGAFLHAVVAISDEHISTPAAYAGLDELYSDFTGCRDQHPDRLYDALAASLSDGASELPELYNIFENVILPICPKAEQIKAKLSSMGATHTLMSGSGPSVFGIFGTESAARAAAEALLRDGFRAHYAHSV